LVKLKLGIEVGPNQFARLMILEGLFIYENDRDHPEPMVNLTVSTSMRGITVFERGKMAYDGDIFK
jgi:hypothetical protein